MMKFTRKINKGTLQRVLFFQVLFLCFFSLNIAGAERLNISNFSIQGTTGWKVQKFKNETRYSIVNKDGSMVAKAESKSSASALIREIDVDLTKTPYLNWSWMIDKVQTVKDEQTKSGDDFSARVYVIVKETVMIWRAKALNYVWSSNQPIGYSWSNPFLKNVKMIALRSGNEEAGRWVNQKQDVRADLKKMFGYDIQTINGIAIMTDTDNSKGSAIAHYGELFFTTQ